MKTKKWYLSKTIWINVLGASVAAINELSGKLIPTDIAVAILGLINVANIYLRAVTDTKTTK